VATALRWRPEARPRPAEPAPEPGRPSSSMGGQHRNHRGGERGGCGQEIRRRLQCCQRRTQSHRLGRSPGTWRSGGREAFGALSATTITNRKLRTPDKLSSSPWYSEPWPQAGRFPCLGESRFRPSSSPRPVACSPARPRSRGKRPSAWATFCLISGYITQAQLGMAAERTADLLAA